MYLKKTKRIYKGKEFYNYLLVKAIRTPKGPTQKTICSLGDLGPRPAEGWLQLAHKLEDALVGQESLFDDADPAIKTLVEQCKQRSVLMKQRETGVAAAAAKPEAAELLAIRPEDVQVEQVREAGPAHVGYQFWKRLGFNEILSGLGFSRELQDLTCSMVLNRLIFPSSEHAMPAWIRASAVPDILGQDYVALNDDTLYRHLDRLYPHRLVIEKELARREATVFNVDQSVFLYDVTSTYFEGAAQCNPKAKRGYSRDKRPDCPQVLVGLVINRDGFPCGHEVFRGNQQDRETLKAMLDALDRRVGLQPGQTVVVDRGMAFDENLAEITSRQLKYIVAARQPERNQWLAEFEDTAAFQEIIRAPSATNPSQKKTPVHVRLIKRDGLTYVLCLSEGRKSKDKAIREKQERNFLTDVAKLHKRITAGRLKDPLKISEAIGRLKERYPRVARYYHLEIIDESLGLQVSKREDKLELAEQLDGSYLLKTNRDDLEAEEAWLTYTMLSRAENAFRAMKSPLSERPIFHHLEYRVETHIFLCILAYHLLNAIERTLGERGDHRCWATLRQVLATHCIVTVVLPTEQGGELRIRRDTKPEREHEQIYRLLSIDSQIMKPKKYWKRNHACRD